MDYELQSTSFVAIDFETTGGVAGYLSVPWQIGVVSVRNGRVDLAESFNSYLRVPREQPFNPYTPGRWGQLRDVLDESPTIQELWPTLRQYLQGRPLVAHNVPTERGVLAREFPFQEFGPWIDTLALARRAYPAQRDFKLENLIPNLGMQPLLESRCPGLAAHDALYDAVACATLLESLLNAPGWNSLALEQLVQLSHRHG